MVSELLIYLSRKTPVILKMKRHKKKKKTFLVTFPHCKELIFSTPFSSKKYIHYCNYNYYNYNHYCQSTLNYVQKWRVNHKTLRSRLFKACFVSFGTMGFINIPGIAQVLTFQFLETSEEKASIMSPGHRRNVFDYK